MNLDRRRFFKTCAAIGAGAVAAKATDAGARTGHLRPDTLAVLVDTTQCIGCGACESACAKQNGNPEPPAMPDDARPRDTTPAQFTVVQKAPGEGSDFAKKSCLHCLVPACASACPVKALDKTEAGPVVYHADRCIGCRYCMVACPFGMPKYEYDKAVPFVRKCTMCPDRLADGKPPACVEACESGALTFGKRSELLAEAQKRIHAEGSTYQKAIYGEHEAGGTSVLYIGSRPMKDFGLPDDVGDRPAYERTASALGAVPLIATLWPPLLMGLYAVSSRREEVAAAAQKNEKPEKPEKGDGR